MKKIKTLIFLPLLSGLLTGCIGNKEYKPEEYMISTNWNGEGEYKILQLSDIHLSQSDVYDKHFDVIKRTINKAKPNMIVLNGDIFTYADKRLVKQTFSFIDSFDVPWTFAYGNHDDQGYYNDTYIQRLLAKNGKYKNVLFKNLQDDNVTGRSNFVINIKNGENVAYQVFVMDSHSYNFDTNGYDFLKQDQIDWYKRIVDYSTDELGGGSVIPSSLYMHIGMTEACDEEYWKEVQGTPNHILGSMEEFAGSPKEDLGIFDIIKNLNSTKSIHVAHDHANDSVIKRDDIYICFGVHSTDRVYNDEKGVKLGGQLLSIDKATKELSFTNLYASYDSDEVKEVNHVEKEAK